MVKVSIPREALEGIMKQYGVDEATASRAFLDAQDQANEAFTRALAERLDSSESVKASSLRFKVPIYTPKQIKEHLDKYVIGQEEYKKRVSIAAAYHFAMLKYLHENPDQHKVKRFRKKNTITAGPSGSGKTYCIEVLGDLLEVPTLIVDATDYTEAGYVGKSADDMIRELIDLAPGSTRKEQANFVSTHGGIIFIDEIDKKAKDNLLAGHDISREGFQRAVLKLIERKQVSIDNPFSPASQIQEAMERQQGLEPKASENTISTENILFILGGSFERPQDNLESIVKKRLSQRGSGFKEDGSFVIQGFAINDTGDDDREKYRNYYSEATAEDYIHFGIIPELVGRSPIRTFVNLLSKNDLVRIMTDTEDSILDQYRMEFSLFNIDLEILPEAIDYVAEISENQRTGARALVSVWENIFTDFQAELPSSNFTKLIVDKKLCERPRDALLKMLEKSPFVDFVEGFRREYGVELILEEEAQQYIEELAQKEGIQVSEAMNRVLSAAKALNYMNVTGPFTVTREMVATEGYFDRLFTKWHQQREAST
ncbi:MAG: AAA family ATPase [Deltaproteobacteria bacterium]|nr:AAA family ATPase [Deltaproteobacteria bacterium]MBW2051907.1 AAA family ATPase [Deltaproteobacteria bacterium]